ncbi:hypothetical protein HOD08_03420 [bacterium]|nr:hypothetical protein [bacterium]
MAGSSRVSNLTTRMYKVSPNGFMNLVSSADHGAAVYSVDFSSDGKFVATGGSRYNSSVTHRVYSVADDGALTEVGSGYDYGNATVKAVAWSTDGKYLATCAHTDPGYRIYSAINGVLEEASYGGSWAGYGISWSPDGRYVAMCGYGQSVRVFSVSDGTLTEIGSGYTHGSYLYAVKWSPDGKYLAAGGISSGSITTRIYSASEGVLTQTATYDHTDRIYGLSWSPDSHFLAMSGENVSGVASVRIHRIQTGGTISSTVNYNPGVDNYECAWDPSGMLLVVGDTTNVRTLTWEDAQVKYTTDFGAEVRDVAWAGSESKFVAAGLGGYEGRAVAGYDFDSTTGVATLNDHLSSIKGGAEVAVFSPNGAYMFLSGYNGPRSKPYLHKIKHGNTLSRGIDLDYGNALRFGYNAVVNADGREIRFSNDNDPQLVLMDGVTGQIKNAVVRNFSTHKTSISSTATLVFGANSYVEFGADSTISDPIKFDGYVVLDGDGHTISFGDSGFSVTPTGTLHLKDAVLRNVVDKPFRCMGNNSTIIFDNVTIHLDGNLSFTKGLFNIKNQVDVTGTYTFDYSSTSTSRILEHSTLRIADDTMFKYSPIIAPTTDSEQLLFADTSSRMHLDGGTFWLNGCDILLRSGTLETSKHSYLKGGTSKNFKFGDGTEANNMNIDLGGTFEVLDNATVYWNNVDS